MARLLLLLLIAMAVVQVAAWWRRRFGPTPPPLVGAAPIAGEFHVETIVREVLFRLHAKAARQLVRFEIAIAETLTFAGDRQALEELLVVLCGHAIETTPCGRVLVTAGARAGGMAIAIVDDGVGMATVRTAGVLELSREVLALLGGKLETASREGVGTTTAILLPAAEPWDATIRNAMTDFVRVTETPPDRFRAPHDPMPAELADASLHGRQSSK